MVSRSFIDPATALLAGTCPDYTQHRAPEADMAALFVMLAHVCLAYLRALPISELCKDKALQLVIAGVVTNTLNAAVAAHAFFILEAQKMLKQQRKDSPSLGHLSSA